jgi:hypothetical protein
VNPLFVSKSDTAKLIVPAGAPVHASGGDIFGGVIVVCPALKQILFIVGDLAKSLPVSVNAPAPDASLPPPSHPSGGHCPASVPPSAPLPELPPLLEPPEVPELLELELLEPLPPLLLPVELPPPLLLELALPPPSPPGVPPAGPLPESLPHIARKRDASETPATAMRRHMLQTSEIAMRECVRRAVARGEDAPAGADNTCARVTNVGYFASRNTDVQVDKVERVHPFVAFGSANPEASVIYAVTAKIPVAGHRSGFGFERHCVPVETAAWLGLLKEQVR